MFDAKVINSIKDLMIQREETIAVAESVTTGLLQTALGSAENASQFFQGGITVYNLAQKFRHLSIEPIHAQNVNCVSDKVSVQMSLNCETLFNSQWAIAITGYASPVPEGDNKLFAYFAVSRNGEVMEQERIESDKEPGLDTQIFYTNSVLQRVLDILKKEKAPAGGAGIH
ncbi:MAG TPA: nicotinamide-nucleotide amidohydrolase family protein [Flavitalea sp.]|nr:nicotinamide-nucleotide amidohydrolase family protein [Flavitalea sp.]